MKQIKRNKVKQQQLQNKIKQIDTIRKNTTNNKYKH